MRWEALLAIVTACAPHLAERVHVDDDVWGARMLHFDPYEQATVRGVVTARGGDAVDWVAFDVPAAYGCDAQRIDLSLAWKAPRGRSTLALTVYDETRTREERAYRRGQRAELTLQSAHVGHYFARISAGGPDDAGAYVLRVARSLG